MALNGRHALWLYRPVDAVYGFEVGGGAVGQPGPLARPGAAAPRRGGAAGRGGVWRRV